MYSTSVKKDFFLFFLEKNDITFFILVSGDYYSYANILLTQKKKSLHCSLFMSKTCTL